MFNKNYEIQSGRVCIVSKEEFYITLCKSNQIDICSRSTGKRINNVWQSSSEFYTKNTRQLFGFIIENEYYLSKNFCSKEA